MNKTNRNGIADQEVNRTRNGRTKKVGSMNFIELIF